jgi:chromosome segregation ATPase
MGDLNFRCIGCQQNLVADDSGAGMPFNCPHCNTAQIIPPHATGVPAEQGELALAAGGKAQAGDGLWSAQERLWQNEHQSSEQAIALVEREQRISALKAECEWLAGQLDEERQRRQKLEPELDLARGEWNKAEKRANEFEASHNHASAKLRHAEMYVEELTRQLDAVKGERSEAVMEQATQQESIAELNLHLNKSRGDSAEMEQILARARADLDRAHAEMSAADHAAEEAAAEADQARTALSHLRAEHGLATTERDRLQAMLREDPDLADYAQARTERDHFEQDLREIQGRLDDYKEKIESLTTEREALKKERTDLQLRIAALRDAHDDHQLQQDNEMLRRMVERLNEQIKGGAPEGGGRKRSEGGGGVVGGLARAVVSRVFVPDPDVAEGR